MTEQHQLEAHIEARGERWSHVHVRRLTGREAISQPFVFDLEVASHGDHGLPDDAYPGAEVTVVIDVEGQEARRIHGVLGPIRDHLEATGNHRTYSLQVRPRASLLSFVETQALFMDQSVPEIILAKLAMHGLEDADVELNLRQTYPKRELVVQFGESDLAFVSRLAEHTGISFFFDHTQGRDRIVFTDHPDGFRALTDAEEVPFQRAGEGLGVFALTVTTSSVPGTYFEQDYNYRKPLVDPTGAYTLDPPSEGGVVEFGGHVRTPDEATDLARIRGEERAAQTRVYEGESANILAEAGRRATLFDHPHLESRAPILYVEMAHDATMPFFNEAHATPPTYKNSFRAIPAGVPYRPPRTTPRPRMPSVVTGIIQPGPGGEVGGVARLDTDGRYTVQLHFDTAQLGANKSSSPLRMMQPYAGQGNGMHFPLLPGSEVIVAFVNGDPDRPIILGAVPNTVSPAEITASEAPMARIHSSKGIVIEFGKRT